MKKKLNKILRNFGAEIHGVGYIEKLRNADPGKNEWLKQNELLHGNATIIFDVGANRGQSTEKYIQIFPQSKIHAFEPFPETCEIFRNKYSGNPSVILNECALSNSIGTATLNVNTSVDTNSILETKSLGVTSDKSCKTLGQIEIKTDTLDHYCKDNNIQKIDILKIDVQGAEIKVLSGSENMLKEGRIQLIYIETYFQQQYVDQPLFHEIAALLYPYNFVVQDIYDPYYSKTSLLWADTIFIKK